MTKNKKSRKRILIIVITILAVVLIGFGSVYIYGDYQKTDLTHTAASYSADDYEK